MVETPTRAPTCGHYQGAFLPPSRCRLATCPRRANEPQASRRFTRDMSSSTPSTPGHSSKIAILRLVQQRPDPPKEAIVSRLNRADRACLGCRSRKIKCNAAKPRCANCSGNTAPCVYLAGRRDRLKTFVLFPSPPDTLTQAFAVQQGKTKT